MHSSFNAALSSSFYLFRRIIFKALIRVGSLYFSPTRKSDDPYCLFLTSKQQRKGISLDCSLPASFHFCSNSTQVDQSSSHPVYVGKPPCHTRVLKEEKNENSSKSLNPLSPWAAAPFRRNVPMAISGLHGSSLKSFFKLAYRRMIGSSVSKRTSTSVARSTVP